jgi:hypothetical protein
VIVIYPWQKQSKPQVEQVQPVVTEVQPKEQPKLSKEAEELKSSLDSLNNSKTKKEVFKQRKNLKEISNKLLEDEAKAREVLSELIENPDIGLQMRAVSILGKAKKPWCNELLIKGTESVNKAVKTASYMYLAQVRPEKKDIPAFAKLCKQSIMDGIKDEDQDIRFSAFKLFCSFSNETCEYKPEKPDGEAVKRIGDALSGMVEEEK